VKNKERRSANISLFIMFIGIFAAVFPFALNVGLDDGWGIFVAFAGAFIAVTGFFIFLMYNGRAKVRAKMFNNENILAHWQYSKEFWDQVTKEDIKDSGLGKVFGFFFGGLFAVIGIIVFFFNTDDNGVFLFIMLGAAVFFVIIGFLAASVEKKRAANSLPEVIIAQDGLFYKNILHTWNAKAISRLESVSMHPAEPNTLLFVTRQLKGGGLNRVHYPPVPLSIPIPPGQEQSALSVINYFNMPLASVPWEEIQKDD